MLDTATLNDSQQQQLTTSQAARKLGLSESMTRLLADRGVLPCARIGVIRVFNVNDVERVRAARQAADQHGG